MIGVRFHRLAAKEMRAAYSWYAARNADAANRFLIAVERAILRIQKDPDSFPIEIQAIRWIRVSRFSYRLVFERIDAAEVMIIAVAHTSRRPRYWRRRI